MVNCIIKGCQSRSEGGGSIRFFQIPKVVRNRCKEAELKSTRRRNLWLARINKPSLREENIKDHVKVCSRHFLKGKFWTLNLSKRTEVMNAML